MPNITTNHAITYTYTKISRCDFIDFQFIDNINKGVLSRTALLQAVLS